MLPSDARSWVAVGDAGQSNQPDQRRRLRLIRRYAKFGKQINLDVD